MAKFKPGELVQLQSGGPLMVVMRGRITEDSRHFN